MNKTVNGETHKGFNEIHLITGFIVVAACVMTFEARDSAAKVVPARFKLSGTRNNTRSSSSNRRNTSGVYCLSIPYMYRISTSTPFIISATGHPSAGWLNCGTVSVIFAYYHCQSEKGCSTSDIRYAWMTFVYIRLPFEYHIHM